MENLIISKSICPSVSYDIGNNRLQPSGVRDPSGVCGDTGLISSVTPHVCGHVPVAGAGGASLGWRGAESFLDMDRICPARPVSLVGSIVPLPWVKSWRGQALPSDTPRAQGLAPWRPSGVGHLMQTDPSQGGLGFLGMASASTASFKLCGMCGAGGAGAPGSLGWQLLVGAVTELAVFSAPASFPTKKLFLPLFVFEHCN